MWSEWDSKVNGSCCIGRSISRVCPSEALAAILPSIGGELTEIDISGCSALEDDGIASIAEHCPLLKKLKMGDVPRVTDAALRALGTGGRHHPLGAFDRYSSLVRGDLLTTR